MTAMSTADYARHRGCSDSYVRRLRRSDRVVLTADGLIDVAATDALLAATDDPTRGGKPVDAPATPEPISAATPAARPIDISLREAMRRERLARARLAELELGEEAGELVRVDQVERDVFTLARQAQERLRTLPGRLRHSLAAATDPHVCEALLAEEIARVCAEMAQAAQVAQANRPLRRETA